MKTLLAACIIVSCLVLPALAYSDDEATNTDTSPANGQATITLSAAAQQLSGIQTTTLTPTGQHAEYTAYGKALNLQPLISLRNRYLLALTTHSSALARYRQAEQNQRRQQELFQRGVSSKRNLQEQQAQWQTEQAQVEASNFQSQAIMDEAVLSWGPTLTHWALSSDPSQLNALVSGKKSLLQITLPANKHLPDNLTLIDIEVSGNRAQAHPAQLISIAAQTEPMAQGESYYFQSDAKLIPGMNVSAWIPEPDGHKTGFIIPKTALLWYLDQAFVYIKTSDNTYSRRAITQYLSVADGYFVSADHLTSGDKVVSLGAQTLLSEQLHGQIPQEDDD